MKKSVHDTGNNTIKQVDYLDGFQYAGGILQFFPHAEGYVAATQGTKTDSNGNFVYIFNYVNNYTDHLGNIRLSYTKDPVSGELEIMEENHYYPFGLKHDVYAPPQQKYELDEEEEELARPTYVYETEYQYKYNAKELQDELGLGMYDYGARNYDPAIGRWHVIDPLAEKYLNISPYVYVANNPLAYIDPNGKDIYRYDDKSGELVMMQETDDDFDQIGEYTKKKGEYVLKTDKKGNAKIGVDNISKGILSDGINFRENNNEISVNGTNEDGSAQPTTQDVYNFAYNFSEYLGVEISGNSIGNENIENDVSSILIWKNKKNGPTHASDPNLSKGTIPAFKSGSYDPLNMKVIKNHFHTHLPGRDADEPSDADNSNKKVGSIYYIIYKNSKNEIEAKNY